MRSKAAALLFKSGANPPSSPTLVASFFDWSTFLRLWNTSQPQRIASLNDSKPSGMTMNSCTSTALSACLPPLRMFIMGAGSTRAPTPPR